MLFGQDGYFRPRQTNHGFGHMPKVQCLYKLYNDGNLAAAEWILVLVTFFGLAVAAYKIAQYIWPKIRVNNSVIPYKTSSGRNIKPEDVYHLVIFFPGDLPENDTNERSALKILTKYLTEAKRSVEICVFVLTSPELADLILSCHTNKLAVCVVIDAELVDVRGSQVKRLQEQGVKFYLKTCKNLMHHKFAIVDGNIVLNGSFNWTSQGVTGNWENLLVTNDPCIVQPFRQELHRIQTDIEAGVLEANNSTDTINSGKQSTTHGASSMFDGIRHRPHTDYRSRVKNLMPTDYKETMKNLIPPEYRATMKSFIPKSKKRVKESK